MSVFSDAELTYLTKGRLGRLATIDGTGMRHVVPLGRRYNPASPALARRMLGLVNVDELLRLGDSPWRIRCELVMGVAVSSRRAEAEPVSVRSHSPGRLAGHRLAYSVNPCQSITTHGSFPTIHASWPGGMMLKSPGPNSICSPSSMTTFIRPDMK